MDERQQINVASIVGSRVQIKLHKPAYEALELQGVESERFVARVLGADNLGVWVENPSYCSVPVYHDDGTYIPPEERREVCDRAVILLKWDMILTIMQFPDRAEYQPPEPGQNGIGFTRRPRGLQAEELVPIGVSPTADNGAKESHGG